MTCLLELIYERHNLTTSYRESAHDLSLKKCKWGTCKCIFRNDFMFHCLY